MLGVSPAGSGAATDIVQDLAPSGTLRAAINFGNPVLVQKDSVTGEPRGVSVDLARELSRRLGVSVETLIGALGPPPPDFDGAAKTLGISVARLREALGAPPR